MIPVEMLDRILIFLLYIAVCPVILLWLVRRLPPSFRLLASVTLASQMFIVAVSLTHTSVSNFVTWLWHIDFEWNIPSLFASAQLALVAGVALLNGWLSPRRPAWQRLYLLGIGFLFLMLAHHDFFAVSTRVDIIAARHPILLHLGILLSIATIVIIETSPKQSRMWLLYLLLGQSLIALGGIIFDSLPSLCYWHIGNIRFEGCLSRVHWEEALELIGGWVALVAMLGHFADDISRPSKRLNGFLFALPGVWVLLLLHSGAIPSIDRQHRSDSAEIVFETRAKLHAYRIEREESSFSIHLYLSSSEPNFAGLGFAIHLVELSGNKSIAGINRYADEPLNFVIAPDYTPVFRHWARLEIPPEAPTQTALRILLSLWHETDGDFLSLKITSSDHPLLGETQAVLREFVLPAEMDSVQNDTFAKFANGYVLAPVDIPTHAYVGEELTIPFTWRAETADGVDYIQFLHFGQEATGDWWIFDQRPLGRRLPTRFWYDGLADTEIWKVALPPELPLGRYSLYTGLYRASDQKRLPAARADGTAFVDAHLPLGSLTIARSE
ncbi:MAG: hypothetical protein OXN88_10815 [Chloroflexota bacterium]|nr:hypothetical protein [Chloroflexota bacterium]